MSQATEFFLGVWGEIGNDGGLLHRTAISRSLRNRGSHSSGTPDEWFTPTNRKGRKVLLFFSTGAPFTRGHSVGTQRQNRFARGFHSRGRTMARTHKRVEGLEVWPMGEGMDFAC